jgi:hypothetical protein
MAGLTFASVKNKLEKLDFKNNRGFIFSLHAAGLYEGL